MSASDFWAKKLANPNTLSPNEAVVLDEQAVSQLQEEPSSAISEEYEDEEDTASLMLDVNLRLEQGRLYQMILQSDIFGETNADPRAIKNVNRKIRKFVREEMEVMVGIRQEEIKQTVVSSPFNDLEVQVLKMLASRVSNGNTDKLSAPNVPTSVQSSPKKDGITPVSGNLRPAQTSPLVQSQTSKPLPKSNPAPIKKSMIKTPAPDESLLVKPINEMSPEELSKHDASALERRSRNFAALPKDMVPHPSPQQLEMLYTQSAANMSIANAHRLNQQ